MGTCALLVLLAEAKRGSKGKGRGKRGKGGAKAKVEGNEPSGEVQTAPPTWVKFCDNVEKWGDKRGKEGMKKRCDCYNSKKNGEKVSDECDKMIAYASKKTDKSKKLTTFERICGRAEKGSELDMKCKCRIIMNGPGKMDKKRACKKQFDGKRKLVKACRDLKFKNPERYSQKDKALKSKCEKLSAQAKKKMRSFVSERHERIMKCKSLMEAAKESLGRDDFQFMRKNCPQDNKEAEE